MVSDGSRQGLSRRRLLGASLGISFGITGASLLTLAAPLRPRLKASPRNAPPHPGDLLVVAQGPKSGEIIDPREVPSASGVLLAWPMDPKTRVVRNANTRNIILLVRAEQVSWFSASEQHLTANLVAAYSAICTHLCCTTSDWVAAKAEHGALLCPCHLSIFDPWDGARVLSGPAPRPLPALPLRAESNRLVVASDFTARVGC